MLMQIFVHSIIRYWVSSFIQSVHLSLVISFYLFIFHSSERLWQEFPCENNATCQSGFTLKGYRCLCPPGYEGERCEKGMSLCQRLKWSICEIFSDSQYSFDKFPVVTESGVNCSQCISCWIFLKENSSHSLLSVCNVLFARSFVYFCLVFFVHVCRYFLFIYLFFISNVWHLFRGKSSSYECCILNRVTARRVQKYKLNWEVPPENH